MKVFIDTSAFIALFVDSEQHHLKVKNKYLEYKNNRAIFYTSDYILDELYTRLLYDLGRTSCLKIVALLKKSIASNEIGLLPVDSVIFEKTHDVFVKYSDHKISFTDATTHVIFKTLKLDEIFTLDNDFKKMRLTTSF